MRHLLSPTNAQIHNDPFVRVSSYIRACLNIFAVSCVVGIIILVPVYRSGGLGLSDFAKSTAANVKESGPELWAMLILGYFFT